MRKSAGIVATLVAQLALAAGCGSSGNTGDTIQGFSATVLSHTGPVAGGVQGGNAIEVVSAATLPDLRAMVSGLGDTLAPNECQQPLPSEAAECWDSVKPPAHSLFLAMNLYRPCNTSHISAALKRQTLTFTTTFQSDSCPPGSGTSPQPALSLVAIPLNRLPAGTLTIILIQDGRQVGRTWVDLSSGANSLPTPSRRFSEIQDALQAAHSAVAAKHLALQPVEIGEEHWNDESLGCPQAGTQSSPADIWGYVIGMGASKGSPSMEFHWGVGRLVPCAVTP